MVILVLISITALAAFCGQDTALTTRLERLDNSTFETPRRPGAVFFHDDHNETAELDDCAVCHHSWENNQLVIDESSEDSPCSECHGLSAGTDNGVSLTAAFHKRCRDCHFKSGKGPVLCGQCHRKE